jgi:hypothetical protein
MGSSHWGRVGVSSHDIEAETSEDAVGMAAVFAQIPYAQVQTVGSTSRAAKEGFETTFSENCPLEDVNILAGDFVVQRTP